MLDIVLLPLYVSHDTYSDKRTMFSRPMWRVQVAMVSPLKMAGPAVITQGAIDRLIAGKNGD